MPKYTQITECNACPVNLYGLGLLLWGGAIIGLLEVYVHTLPFHNWNRICLWLRYKLKVGDSSYMPYSLFFYSRHKHLCKVKWSWKKQLSNKGANTFLFHKVNLNLKCLTVIISFFNQSKQKLFKWWDSQWLQPCSYLIL